MCWHCEAYLVISLCQAFTILSTLHILGQLALIATGWDGLTVIIATDQEVPQVTELISGGARSLTPAASSRVIRSDTL